MTIIYATSGIFIQTTNSSRGSSRRKRLVHIRARCLSHAKCLGERRNQGSDNANARLSETESPNHARAYRLERCRSDRLRRDVVRELEGEPDLIDKLSLRYFYKISADVT